MTALRQRLIEDLTLRGYAQRTIGAYVAAVARLSRFFHAAPTSDGRTAPDVTVQRPSRAPATC
jgi:hypothetical protein